MTALRYVRVKSVEKLVERSHGTMRKSKRIVEVRILECLWIRGHDELIVSGTFVPIAVVEGTNAVQHGQHNDIDQSLQSYKKN